MTQEQRERLAFALGRMEWHISQNTANTPEGQEMWTALTQGVDGALRDSLDFEELKGKMAEIKRLIGRSAAEQQLDSIAEILS